MEEAATRQKNGAIYGITSMRNGVLVGRKAKSPKDRVKRYLILNPGARSEQVASALRMTQRMAESAIASLSAKNEIYTENPGPYAKWFAGEYREAPRGLINSIWDFAQKLGQINLSTESH